MAEQAISDAKDEKELVTLLEAQGWELDEGGTVRNPGKFEGEHFMVLYFWDMAMNGFEDEEEYDEYDRPISIFHIKAEDRKSFPSLGRTEKIRLWESDQGFVMSDWEG